VAHLQCAQSDDRADSQLTRLLSQTVTLHWLAQTLKDHATVSVDDYLRLLLQQSSAPRQSGRDSRPADVTV